uniref:FZ domain-containing protein n=1 Tax=Hanusia phi TaxID=3032 RepID=A0A7S0F2S3_9CRYP|mmetsp:Transcript_36806/g.82969  ORF Transcript_36806/g.82969 Transcript_36806/m.82969 type:complete len:358 (+) Transcript_36806:230-1303(+)
MMPRMAFCTVLILLAVNTLGDDLGSSHLQGTEKRSDSSDLEGWIDSDLSLDHDENGDWDDTVTSRHLLSWTDREQENSELYTSAHAAVHAAAVRHAHHKLAKSRARSGSKQSGKAANALANKVGLPKLPQSPPVCSIPPAMRFCQNVNYPVYRPSVDHTFAQLDFDSHAVFKKIVPHMRISERHFELPVIHQCRANFRQFLCLRNFPKCCHVGLCSKYGSPDNPLTTQTLNDFADAAHNHGKATTVTFLNGVKDTMKVDQGRNDTVKVKVSDATCVQYMQTYTPLFDCRKECQRLLSKDCLFMLSQECEDLCFGVHSEKCASKQLYQIATGKSGAAETIPSLALYLATLTVLFRLYH